METLVLDFREAADSPGRFDCSLAGDFVLRTRSPLFAGARALLAKGFDPKRLLTTRAHGAAHNSFTPEPIGRLAKWSVSDGDANGMKMQSWRPAKWGREGAAVGSE